MFLWKPGNSNKNFTWKGGKDHFFPTDKVSDKTLQGTNNGIRIQHRRCLKKKLKWNETKTNKTYTIDENHLPSKKKKCIPDIFVETTLYPRVGIGASSSPWLEASGRKHCSSLVLPAPTRPNTNTRLSVHTGYGCFEKINWIKLTEKQINTSLD